MLSVQQLYRISTMYWDDRYGTETVSQEVLGLMKQLMMQDTNSAVSNSFLLDDDSSIPFSVEAISAAMADTNIPRCDRESVRQRFAGSVQRGEG